MSDERPLTDLIGLDPGFTDGLSAQEYKYATSCGRYEQCKQIEAERDEMQLVLSKESREFNLSRWNELTQRVAELEAELDLTRPVVEAARRFTAQFERRVTGWPRRDALCAAVDALDALPAAGEQTADGRALPLAIGNCICSYTVHEAPGAVELNADADCPIHGEKAAAGDLPDRTTQYWVIARVADNYSPADTIQLVVQCMRCHQQVFLRAFNDLHRGTHVELWEIEAATRHLCADLAASRAQAGEEVADHG